ncbi:MAG: tRNA (guanine-N1)-methyltransferase [Nodosilinea sp.]
MTALQEGKATFWVNGAFYRPQSKIARDLAVLMAVVQRQRQGKLRVLDAMSGCGVRSLRYALEAQVDWVWANEANPDLAQTLAQNLAALPANTYRMTCQDANQAFFACAQTQDFYDLVDIDNFGGPSPYASIGMWATRLGGLLYLTSTDGRSTGGHDPDRSLRIYPAYARSHPAVHEQGLRLLIGHAVQQAASRGLGIEPVFALFTGQVHRAMVRLVPKPTLTPRNYGLIAYCHRCGHFQTVDWRRLGRVDCPGCEGQGSNQDSQIVISGPLWLGALHDGAALDAMAGLAINRGWAAPTRLLQVMREESELPPYYYSLGEIGRRGQMDIPNRDRLITALQERGYRATVTHVDWQGLKTNAAFRECLAVARKIAST